MTPARKKIHALVAIVPIALAACTPTRPPVDELAAAARALNAAREAGAPELAAADFRSASLHLDQARVADRDQDYDVAAQLAAESQVDSELALARARAARARAAVDRLSSANAGLEHDLGGAPTEEQP
jgi:hypothetical protein